VLPFVAEAAERLVAGEAERAIQVLRQRVPLLRQAVVVLVVRRIGEGGFRALERLAREGRDAREHRAGFLHAAEELQIHESADQLVEGVVLHAGVAVGLHGLGPFGEEPAGLVHQRRVAGGAGEPRHPGQPLPEHRVRVHAAPAAERPTRRREPGGRATALQDVRVGHAQVVITAGRDLLLPAARQERHSLEVEWLETSFGRERRNGRRSRRGDGWPRWLGSPPARGGQPKRHRHGSVAAGTRRRQSSEPSRPLCP
jgi:hypothetical protein